MLVLLMTLTLIPVDALAETAAENSCGSKGDNLTWALDKNGVLTKADTGRRNVMSYTMTDDDYFHRYASRYLILQGTPLFN